MTNQHNIVKFNLEDQIPLKKPTYVKWGNHSLLKQIIEKGQFFTMYITGESGTGKNEMVSQVCAELKRPMVRVSITRDTKEDHLIGSKTMVDGNIVYEEGPVKWCAENGAILLLDEISLADPNEIMVLQNVLEGEPFFVKSANEMVFPKPGFCVIATDNTKGRGNSNGKYIGVNMLNDAFLERFQMTMVQDYPTKVIETKIVEKILKKHNLEEESDVKFGENVISWAHAIRSAYKNDAIDDNITTRRVSHIMNTYAVTKKPKDTIQLCTQRFDETTHMAMMSLWDKIVLTEESVDK